MGAWNPLEVELHTPQVILEGVVLNDPSTPGREITINILDVKNPIIQIQATEVSERLVSTYRGEIIHFGSTPLTPPDQIIQLAASVIAATNILEVTGWTEEQVIGAFMIVPMYAVQVSDALNKATAEGKGEPKGN